ncbi:NAD(P)-dependent oxidoreductase [Mycobacterium sp. CVI_P3]|uniref:NAD(P)-dependent oxidoreductase n=1 Tax=Mycobacterium pinniadriaticum TaxID=2994102 RepID=A0ABT3SET1_9MYCO|nr:NAD(P)-dependent oxidoreductase [Mycobacterium pinniadriaticum]MCX2931580.1 NAD(P)-dependent oxidoreductase [Mycobacterium pinniadriaticum]MCX2938028.1 NAD(P)-dependent oxidoreductase [Mycobacterium pinniadriaticum]
MNIGFVGAGRMGAPMVRRLLDAGHDVTVLGRTPEKLAAAEELGATPADNLTELARDADAVVVCVFTDDQVRQVCLTDDLLGAMHPGSVLVLHTTGSPSTAEAIAGSAGTRGIGVLDAPVSGGPHDIAAGTVTLFVGGDDDAVQLANPVLSSYGDPVLHVGPLGFGQRVKLINNALFAAQIGTVAEAVRLGDRLGVDESTLLSALPHGSGASFALSSIARVGSAAGFIGAVGEFIGKDVAVVRATVADLGSDLGLLDDVVNAGLTPAEIR